MTPMKLEWERPGPILREFLPGDQIRARELILAGLEEHFGVLETGLNPDLDDIASYYPDRGGVFVVAECDGEVIGTGGLLRDGDGVWRMVRVSVAAGQRGRGLGGTIVDYLVERAAIMGGIRIWTETNDDWDAALRLYRRHGFREFRRCDGNVYFEKSLRRAERSDRDSSESA